MPRSHSWACDWCVPIQKKEARPLLQDLLRENKTTPAPIDQPCPTNLFMGIIEARGPSEQGWEIWRQWRWTFRAETSGELKDVSQGGLGPHHGGAQEFWRNPLICPQPEQEASTWPPATQRWCLSSLQLACGSSLAGAIEPPLKGRSYGTYSVLTGEWGFDGNLDWLSSGGSL